MFGIKDKFVIFCMFFFIAMALFYFVVAFVVQRWDFILFGMIFLVAWFVVFQSYKRRA